MSRIEDTGTVKDYKTDVLQRETKLTSHVRDKGEEKDHMRKCQDPHEKYPFLLLCSCCQVTVEP